MSPRLSPFENLSPQRTLQRSFSDAFSTERRCRNRTPAYTEALFDAHSERSLHTTLMPPTHTGVCTHNSQRLPSNVSKRACREAALTTAVTAAAARGA
eukprot:6911316-Prymnesium_polylepis.2